MKRRLVLFDIDGTLLTSASAGRSALLDAFRDEFPDLRFFDRVPFGGKTDPQIIAELYAAAGTPQLAESDRIAMVLERYLGHLERHLTARHHLVQPCPGIVELLAALQQHRDVVVGLLTGNIVPGAKLKLGAAGIAFSRFELGAFGSDSAHRPDLPAIAARRAEALFGRVPSGAEVVIIGDTPADVTCGGGIGARSVAVATGDFSRGELEAAGAHAAFDSFADTARAVAAIVA